MSALPAGFTLLTGLSPFIETNGPFYTKMLDSQLIFGLRVQQQHCNRGNKLHGGMVCTIADIAIGHNIALSLWSKEMEQTSAAGAPVSGPPGAPMTTISMSTDFTGSASLGDWVEVHVDVHRTGKSLAFANAFLACKNERVARVSAIFKLLRV